MIYMAKPISNEDAMAFLAAMRRQFCSNNQSLHTAAIGPADRPP
jgi:hypothetical protein